MGTSLVCWLATAHDASCSKAHLFQPSCQGRAYQASPCLWWGSVRGREDSPGMGGPCSLGSNEVRYSLPTAPSVDLGWAGHCSVHGLCKICSTRVLHYSLRRMMKESRTT